VGRAAAAAASARPRLRQLNSRLRRAAALALLALLLPACGGGGTDDSGIPAPVDEANVWNRADPADLGVDEAALARADDRIPVESPYLRSLLVVRDGLLVFERYYGGGAADQVLPVYSITKSVVSTVVGIALADGKLESVDQRLAEFFPDYAKGGDPRLSRLTLEDLLTMRAGFSTGPIQASSNWTQALMMRPFEHEPGKVFVYDGGSSHLLSAVLTKVTGERASVLAQKRIFRPLGIADGWSWPDDPQGVSIGGDGLAMRARDLAKLGQLYLQEGRWNGRQIVPAAWVRRSTRKHTDAGAPGLGYGYQWWVQNGPRGKAYAALGIGGQAIVVLPALDLVIVLTTVPRRDTDVRRIVRLILPAVDSR
jgi:CubicO group peptidase (beta-lactamase class C family)